MSTGTSTPTSTPTPSAPSGERERPDEDESGQGEKGFQLPRREWSLPGLHLPVFYFSDDQTHQAISAIYEGARGKYGQEEATGYLRDAILERGPNGRAVLALLRQLLPAIAERVEDPRERFDLGEGFQDVPD